MLKENSISRQPISRNTLKIIACIAMLCDHAGKSYIQGIYGRDSDIYFLLCDVIGRIAFPIFCALFIQGIMHTKNEMKHLITLGVFAVISEPCFDLAIYHKWVYVRHQNVMLSWLLSCITIVLLKNLYAEYKTNKLDICAYVYIYLLIILLLSSLSFSLFIDYKMFIVPITGIVFFVWKTFPNLQFWVIGAIIAIAEAAFYKTPGTLLAIPFMMLYDSTKIQKNNNVQRYSFYAFYPLHLLILGFL